MEARALFIARQKVSLLILFALLAAIITLSILAAIYPTFPGDDEALKRFQGLESSGLNTAARAISSLGSVTLVAASIGVLIVALWVSGRRRDAMASLLIPLAEGLVFGIKALIGRPRPELALFPAGPGTATFPSGHANHAVLFFGFLIYLCLVHVESARLRVALQGLLMLSILGVGASRVYLGLHWPSDVVGGYVFGAFFLLVLVWLVKTGKERTALTK